MRYITVHILVFQLTRI